MSVLRALRKSIHEALHPPGRGTYPRKQVPPVRDIQLKVGRTPPHGHVDSSDKPADTPDTPTTDR